MLKLDEVAAELEDDMRSSGWAGRTVTLKFKLDTYQGAYSPKLCAYLLMELILL